MAATPTKKSAAYEAGLREGRADKSKKPKIEIEISPEGEEEEGPEGEEEMDGASAKAKPPSRKRSAKNAKSTKAPMDGDCGCGGAKKGHKSTCDGSCGGMKRDRADSALTPHEYLAACELGIQDRSRPYIRARLDAAMTLTPSTIRNDLKCGRGAISPGEKCTKGAATQAEQAPRRGGQRSGGGMKGGRKIRGLKTAAKLVGAAALIGGAAYMQQTARRNTMERRSLANPMSAAGMAFKAQTLRENISPKAVRNIRERAAMNAAARRWAKRDSVYASGFTADLDQLAI